jgi:hypothetical protein
VPSGIILEMSSMHDIKLLRLSIAHKNLNYQAFLFYLGL